MVEPAGIEPATFCFSETQRVHALPPLARQARAGLRTFQELVSAGGLRRSENSARKSGPERVAIGWQRWNSRQKACRIRGEFCRNFNDGWVAERSIAPVLKFLSGRAVLSRLVWIRPETLVFFVPLTRPRTGMPGPVLRRWVAITVAKAN